MTARMGCAGAAAASLLTLVGAAAGAQVTGMTSALGAPLPAQVSASVTAAADGSAVLEAPAGTPVLAVIPGTVTAPSGGARIEGDREATGVAVEYDGVVAAAPAGRAERGDTIGRLASDRLTLRVTVDGHPLDTAAALHTDVDPSGRMVARPLLGAQVTQEFGCTSFAAEPPDPFCLGGHFHSGIDLAAPLGTPVQAALGGTVHVVDSTGGYGRHILIENGEITTVYAHLDTALVADGDVVASGGLIGTVGSTGNSTGPHLHFEVRRHGVPEDPRRDLDLP